MWGRFEMYIKNYSNIDIKTLFSEYKLNDLEPLELNIEIKGDSEKGLIKIGEAKIEVFNQDVIKFEISDGYEDRQSEAFKSVRYVDWFGKEYFENYHPQTTTVEGRVAYLDRIIIYKEFRGNRYGSLAFKDICLYLRTYLSVDFIILFPYPIEWDEVDGRLQDTDFILEETEKIISYYKKLGFELTYGVLNEPYLCLDIRDTDKNK